MSFEKTETSSINFFNVFNKMIPNKKKMTIKGYIELINNYQIHGWVFDTESKALTLSLRINKAVYPVTPVWYKREDVATHYGNDAFLNSGFTINIPESIRSVFALEQQNNGNIDVVANDVPLKHIGKQMNGANNIKRSKTKLKIDKQPPKKRAYVKPAKINKLFVCIGAQKAGTSWLFENLSRDSRFARCPFVKEIHYFDALYKNSPHLNNWRAHYFLKLCQGDGEKLSKLKSFLSVWISGDMNKFNALIHNSRGVNKILARRLDLLLNELTDDWYANLLRINEGQEYAMDITPDYAVIGQTGFEHMKSIAGNVKILFILRNPVDRAWSGLLQGKKKASNGISGFLKEKGTDIDYLFTICTAGIDIGTRNDYLATLEELDAVGLLDGRVLIKFYDDLVNSPERFIEDIYQFLELPPASMDIFSETLRSRVNVTQKTLMPDELRLRLKEYYSGMLKEINERFVKIPPDWL